MPHGSDEDEDERRGSESAWLTREGHDTRNWNYGCIAYNHSTRPSLSESLASDDRPEIDADGWPRANKRLWGSETFGALGGGSDVNVDGFTGFKEKYAKYVVEGEEGEGMSPGPNNVGGRVAISPMQRQSNAGSLTDRTTSALSSHHFSDHSTTTAATQTNPASGAHSLFGDYNWGRNHLVGPQSQTRRGHDYSLVSPDSLTTSQDSLGRTNLEPESERTRKSSRTQRAPSKFQ